MKTIRLLLLAAVVPLCAAGGEATPEQPALSRNWWGRTYTGPTEPKEKFLANETSVDAFATYIAAETKFSHLFQTDITDGQWGGGLGLNHFFTPIIGISGEVRMGDNGGNFVDAASASAVARLPIEEISLAPYAFAGVGRRTDSVWEWIEHVGIGLEYRFNRETGVFADARYEWADKTSDAVLFRMGLRLSF